MTRLLVANARSGANRVLFAFVGWLRHWLSLGGTAYLSEAHRVKTLRRAGHVAQASDGSKGKREVAIVSFSPFDEVEHIQLTPSLLNTRISHDRWATRGSRGLNDDWSLHANAAIQEAGRLKNSPGAIVWAAGLGKLEAILAARKAVGRRAKGGGDLNWRGTEPVPGSPAEMFDRLEYDYVNRELLWAFWDRRYWRLARWRPIKVLNNPPGSDHIALRVRLRRVWRKK